MDEIDERVAMRRQERIRRARERRRKQIRNRIILIAGVLALVLILCFTMGKGKGKETLETEPETTPAETTEPAVTEPPTEPTLSPEELAKLPEDLQYMYEKNEESRPFVMGYWENRNKTYDTDLSAYMGTGTVAPLMQWDERWGYTDYAGTVFGRSGCGPMCLSLAALYFTGDTTYTPQYVAQYATENRYASDGNGTEWALFTYGAADFGLESQELHLEKREMVEALEEGKLVVCIMGPGDFTESGHYILVTGYENDAFSVWDTNRRANSEKTWTFEELSGQIRNLWSICKAEAEG